MPVNEPVRNPGDTFNYTDSADFIRNFETVDFASLPPNVFADSLRQALRYAAEDYCIRDHNFTYFYQWGLPFATRKVARVDAEGVEHGERVIVPVEQRVAKTSWMPWRSGTASYIGLLEWLSAHRMDIDFHRFYRRYRPAIRRIITKEIYDRNYSRIVNKLIAAYEDLEADPERYEKVALAMELHWEYTRDLSNHYDLCELYPFFQKNNVVSPEAWKVMEANSNDNETIYSNIHLVVWAYSFWLRRQNEGKKEEIIQILRSVRADYARMS